MEKYTEQKNVNFQDNTIKTWSCPAGTFQGIESENCYQLYGIRYAQSERFGAPTPYYYPKGLQLCQKKSPYAVQNPSKVEEYLFGVDYSQVIQEESCQYLSITIPKNHFNDAFPVMVWIHGGAFRNGGCDHDCYDSDLLAAEGNVIVVRINYRLGVLGYVRDQKENAANLGLLDVIYALQWIQENIEFFGGDKENVTLFGQSAGAQIIAGILVADGTDTLFKNAIMQSTPLGTMVGRQAMDEKILKEMNQMPVHATIEEIRQQQEIILQHITEKGAPKFMPFAPHYGVAPLPSAEEAKERLRKRASRHPLLIGCNAREVSAYIGNNKTIAMIDRFVLTRRLIEKIIKKKSEEIFITPSKEFAAHYAKAGGVCWYYHFDWRKNDSVIGACHCMELVLLFGGKGLVGRDIAMGLSQNQIYELGKKLRAIWSGFAKNGKITHQSVFQMIDIQKL